MLNLVTGATGFIGSHLVEALIARGESVRALVRPTSQKAFLRELGVEIRIGNLWDNAALAAAAQGAQRVYHCAALVSDWGLEADFRQTNVNGVRNVLAAAKRANVSKFIFLSTSDVYGFPGRPVDESEPLSPRGFPYADTKIEGERLVWNHRRRLDFPACILRPATVYGPRSGLMAERMVTALRARRMPLIDGGEHVAGLTYVGNLVDAMLLAADDPDSVGEAYNVSDGSDVTWGEYIRNLATLAEVPPPTRDLSHNRAFALATIWEQFYRLMGRTERPPLTRMMVELMGTDQRFPIDKARDQLGYSPRVSFMEGLQHTERWLRREGLLEWT